MIHNDEEFKSTLYGRNVDEQRLLAARFAEHVMALSDDARIRNAVQSAMSDTLTDDELHMAHQLANAAKVDSYTQCGHECNWHNQAGHFVALATLDSLTQADAETNIAWDAAMHARMARTCETIAEGNGTHNDEADTQYQITTAFLHT